MTPTDYSIIYYVPELSLKFYNLAHLRTALLAYGRIDATIIEKVNTDPPYLFSYPYTLGPI